MKLVSWNVNGLRACIQKGFLDVFRDLNADFFCLQETKLSEGQLQLDLPGYEQYWCYAEKKGYSGTAIFTRHTPLSVQYGIGVPELDHEGRVITLEYKEFYLVTCYTPNAQRELARIGHRMTWDEAFRAFLRKLDAVKPVILCGDLNVAHKEIDLKNPAANRGNAGFSDQERESFQKTLDLGFTDTFRHLHPDKTGVYSWWSYMFKAREENAGWRIDYFLVSDRIANTVYRADIHSDIFGSDHCPVSVDLNLLVNGSLFSPESAGIPRVVEPETTPKKQAKSSPISGKDFASIIPIAALLLLFVVGAFALFDHSPTSDPSANIPPVTEISFDVEIYYTPLAEDWYQSNATSAAIIALQDDSNTYFTSSIDYFSTANVFLRISGVEQNLIADPSNWNLSFAPLSQTMNSNGVAQSVDFESLTIQPYYSDSQMTHFAGWLVWGRLPNHYWNELEFTLSITSSLQAHASSFTTQVALFPYLTADDAKSFTTEALLRHIVNHPVISKPIIEVSVLSFYTNYNSLLEAYPALAAFQNRADSVDALLFTDLDMSTELCSRLLGLDNYRSFMTPEQEYLTLTHQYPNTTPLQLNNPTGTVRDLSTKDLLNSAFDCLLILAQCSTEESAALTYTYLANNSIYLDALASRSDAVSVIMNSEDVFYGTINSSTGSVYTLYLAADYLLSQSVYRQKMTPLEEAQYLCGRYLIHDTPIYEVPDLDSYSLESLLYSLMNVTDFNECLRRATSLESCYYIYCIQYDNNPYLCEFASREDAFEYLGQSVQTQPGEYARIYECWNYMLQRTQAESMTNQELLDRLYEDHITESIREIAPNNPYLSTLMTRSYAVDFLMNCTPPDDSYNSILPYSILQVLHSQMTPAQQARMITGDYPSSPTPFTFSLHSDTDPAAMSTQEIVEYLDKNGTDIYLKYLLYTNNFDVKAEIYGILRLHSNLLLELETRTDAVDVLQRVYGSSTNPFTPVGELRYLYENYVFGDVPEVSIPDESPA